MASKTPAAAVAAVKKVSTLGPASDVAPPPPSATPIAVAPLPPKKKEEEVPYDSEAAAREKKAAQVRATGVSISLCESDVLCDDSAMFYSAQPTILALGLDLVMEEEPGASLSALRSCCFLR